MQKVLFTSQRNDWETPQELFDALNGVFHFTLDAAASVENHKCERYYTKNDNGVNYPPLTGLRPKKWGLLA